MVRRLLGTISISLLVLALEAGPTFASGPRQASDPSANSPAGVMYSIPLDSARQDAAPHRSHHHVAVVASGGPAGGSGAPAAAATATGTATATAKPTASRPHVHHRVIHVHKAIVLIPGGEADSLIHSANGFGSSSRVPGLSSPVSPGLSAVDGSGTSAPLLAIILAIVVLAVGAFVGARAMRQPRAQG